MLCRVGVAFVSNADSPTEQSNISFSQTHALSKALDVCDTALAMRRSYTSILQGLDKLWANSHPQMLPLHLPRPSQFFPLPSRIHRPPASTGAGNLRQPPTTPRSAGYVGPRLRDRDASSPARGAVSDPHPRQRDDFHKYPSDTHWFSICFKPVLLIQGQQQQL